MEKKMRPIIILYILSILLTLSFSSCAHGIDSPMSNLGHMMGYGWGGGFMRFMVVVIAGIAIYFTLQVMESKGSDGSIIETPLDILKKRYVKGDIDKEEFERKKKDLES